MFRIIIYLFFFGSLLVSCNNTKKIAKATGDISSTNQKQDIEELSNSLLWKIEGKGLEQASYLFGTIHMITSDEFYWPKGTLAAFDEVSSVVFEIDMDDMFDISKQMSLLTKAFMNDGKSLKDFYSEEDYKLIKSHFEDIGIPLFFLERLKPMFLTVFASGDVEFGAGMSGNSRMKSYEMELYELSEQSQKKVKGLETIEFQLSVFDSIPYQVQADMLLETIKSSDIGDDSFKEMVQMYKQQDITRMVSSMSEDESIGEYEDLLLHKRNANWIPLMEELMKSEQMFFAVGAGHLAGSKGVIRLLIKEGYTLTPISNEL